MTIAESTDTLSVEVGMALSDFDGAPPGIEVISEGGTTYRKQEAGSWESSRGRVRSSEWMSTRATTFTVFSVPPELRVEADLTPVEGVKAPALGETLDRYKRRFETVLQGCAQYSGVTRESFPEVMRTLEVPTPEDDGWVPVLGMPVSPRDERLLALLPPGTVLERGLEPANWRSHCIVRTTRHDGLDRIVGGGEPYQFDPLYVIHLPGEGHEKPEWVTRPATAADLREVDDFKERALRLGLNVKQRHSWCGELEQSLRRVDVYHDRPRVAEFLSVEDVAALPRGAMVRLQGAETLLLVRDDRYTNPARTRRLGGNVPGDWTDLPVEVAWSGSGAMSIPVLSHDELAQMPAGTTLVESGSRFTKSPDGFWRRPNNTYGYNSTDFSLNYTMHYVAIPI